MNLPSIKTLRQVFGDDAPRARAILEMTRRELAQHPVGAKRIAECWHQPDWWDIRMHCLDALGHTYGVEAIRLRDGRYVPYLNAGDTYATTLLRFNGRYTVGCWGDIAERHGAE